MVLFGRRPFSGEQAERVRRNPRVDKFRKLPIGDSSIDFEQVERVRGMLDERKETQIKQSKESIKSRQGRVKHLAKLAKLQKQEARFRFSPTKQVKQFGKVIQRQQEPFSQEQEAMMNLMSGGSINKMWGFNNEPVRINHDLNPRQRGDESTGAMFGF